MSVLSHNVNRIVVDADCTFEELRDRYEAPGSIFSDFSNDDVAAAVGVELDNKITALLDALGLRASALSSQERLFA